MNICKDNPYLENILNIIFTWMEENSITSSVCYKCFGTAWSRSDFEDCFINRTKSPTVSTTRKILAGLGYSFEFQSLNGKLEYDGNLRNFLKSVLLPYRPQYLYEHDLLSRSTYTYIMRKRNDNNELYISLEAFTYILYVLNIQLILKKV